MTIENYFTSLAVSEKLLKSGIKNHSIFNWVSYPGVMAHYLELDVNSDDHETKIPAYTAQEILEMLPAFVQLEKKTYELIVDKFVDRFTVSYSRGDRRNKLYLSMTTDHLPDTAAYILLDLIRDKIFEVKK